MTTPTNTTEPTAPVVDPVVEPSTLDVQPDVTTPTPATDPAASKLDLDNKVSKTGNTTFDQVGKLLSDKGITGLDTAFAEIAQTGEVPLAMQASLVEALGDGVADLVISQLNTEVDKIKSERMVQTTATLDYAAAKFGVDKAHGQDVWKDVQTFVRSTESGFTAEDRAILTNMVQAGGLQAQLALDKIHSKFQAVQGIEQPADLLQGTTYAQTSFEPLSNREYAKEMRKIVAEHGYESRQANELRARRLTSQKRGY